MLCIQTQTGTDADAMMATILAEENGMKAMGSLEKMIGDIFDKKFSDHAAWLASDHDQLRRDLRKDILQMNRELANEVATKEGLRVQSEQSTRRAQSRESKRSSRASSNEVLPPNCVPVDAAEVRRPSVVSMTSSGYPRTASKDKHGFKRGRTVGALSAAQPVATSKGGPKGASPEVTGGGAEDGNDVMAWADMVGADDHHDSFKSTETRTLRTVLAAALAHPASDITVGLLILVNSVMLGMVTHIVATDALPEAPKEFRNAETVFCFLFGLEIAIRMYVVGIKSFFVGPDWHWNMFDFLIVGMQVVDELMTVTGTEGGANMSFARVFKLLKMIRVAKVARIARMIRELRTLIASIVGSMKNLIWTAILLMLMVYMVGIFLTTQVTDFRLNYEVPPEEEARLVYFYGDLALSMQSLFEAISGGIDWDAIVRPLTDNMGAGYGFLFVMYVSFSTMCLMNVVTGVFVESVLTCARLDREQFLVSNALQILNEGGEMNLDQFLTKVDTPQMQDFFKAIAPDADPKELFAVVDADGSGLVDADEFLNGCMKLSGPAKSFDTALLVQLVTKLETHMKGLEKAEDSLRQAAQAAAAATGLSGLRGGDIATGPPRDLPDLGPSDAGFERRRSYG